MSPEAPVQDPATEPTPAAPVQAAPDSLRTTDRGGAISYEFINPDVAREIETQPPVDDSATTDAKAPAEQAAPADRTSDLTPEEIKRFERSEAAQARIQQLADNKAGNLVQREREKLRDQVRQELAEESAAWAKADEGYQFLSARGRDAFMERFQLSERDAAQWEADYLSQREQRGKPQTDTTPQAVETIRASFNDGAIAEFKEAVASLLPFYGDLPAETRAALDAVKFSAEGNWLADSLSALAKGIAARDEQTSRAHKAALDEARTAGANLALAEREEQSPIIVNAKPNDMAAMSNQDLDMAYADNVITRATYHAEKARRGIDY